jgi:hypothetical protein
MQGSRKTIYLNFYAVIASEAIHLASEPQRGLLRSARNDVPQEVTSHNQG